MFPFFFFFVGKLKPTCIENPRQSVKKKFAAKIKHEGLKGSQQKRGGGAVLRRPVRQEIEAPKMGSGR